MLKITLTILLVSQFLIADNKNSNMGFKSHDTKQYSRMEPETIVYSSNNSFSEPYQYNNRDFSVSLIDFSSNGWGLAKGTTNPITLNNDGNVFFTFRQYIGENTTHGQIGASFSYNGSDYTLFNNINYNGSPPWGADVGVDSAQGRYPSALMTVDYPYAFWNEYTNLADGSDGYGGRPYYSYDELELGGGAFTYPSDIDSMWDESKDLWMGSPDLSYEYGNVDEPIYNIVYEDWINYSHYIFTSEVTDHGSVIMNTGVKVFDHDFFMYSDPNDNYTGPPIVSINNSGHGAVVQSTKIRDWENLSGVQQNMVFKITDNHGSTWSNQASLINSEFDGYSNQYFSIPEEIFNDIQETYFHETFCLYPDGNECWDLSSLNSLWVSYDYDFKIDSNGNLHFLLALAGVNNENQDVYYNWPGSGYYHISVHFDNLILDDVSASAWSISKVANMEQSWSCGITGDDSYNLDFPTFEIYGDNQINVVFSAINTLDYNIYELLEFGHIHFNGLDSFVSELEGLNYDILIEYSLTI